MVLILFHVLEVEVLRNIRTCGPPQGSAGRWPVVSAVPEYGTPYRLSIYNHLTRVAYALTLQTFQQKLVSTVNVDKLKYLQFI